MEKICDLYTISDREKNTLESVNFVLKYYPNNPRNPYIHEKLIKLYENIGKPLKMNKERLRLNALFGEGTAWREANIKNTRAIINADELIQKNLLAVAYYYQKRGDKEKSRRDYIKAAYMYYNFLNKYQGSDYNTGARHNYAQILYNLGDYDGAIQEYNVVLDIDEESIFKESASFSIVSAWQRKIKLEDPKYTSKEIKPQKKKVISKKDKKTKTVLLPKQKLNAKEEKLLSAIKRYETINPTGKKMPVAWYIAAEVYFRNNHFEEARDRYQEIILKYPNEKIAVEATKNIIATYNHQGNYSKVEEWSKKLLASGGLGGSKKDVKQIQGLLTGSLFKSAQQLEEDNSLSEAADEYVRLAEQYPSSEYSDAALYNAGLIYEKLGKPLTALTTYNSMIKKYPKSVHGANAMFRVAVNYEQQLEFKKAESVYERITKKYNKSPLATDSYYNVSRLSRANNRFKKSAKNLILYHNRVKDKNERSLALMQAAKLYERVGNKSQALKLYKRYIVKNNKDLDGVVESYIKSGRIYESLKKRTAAINEYKKAFSTFKKSGSPQGTLASHYAAEARYRIVYDSVIKYNKIRIKSTSINRMKSLYTRKEKSLQKIADQYLKIVEMGSPEWSIASLYMIGKSFQEFADFLYEAPVPKELNTNELRNEYKNQLQMQAIPFEDKAIEYYEKSIGESARLKIVNDWTRKAKFQMAQLKPDQYFVEKEEISLTLPSLDLKDYGYIGQ
jgi:tetratricopeptide (TPR) repeat protein